MSRTRLYSQELDGQKIAYSSETEFLVQIGKGLKGGYRTKYRIVGNLGQAVMYFNGINIGNGYKKRLYMPSSPNGGILARVTS